MIPWLELDWSILIVQGVGSALVVLGIVGTVYSIKAGYWL